jgi:hypothetical protein
MLLDEIATYLVNVTQGTLDGKVDGQFNVHRDRAPDDVNDCVAIAEYPGSAPVLVLGSGKGISRERPRMQVLCRSKAYATARTNAEIARTWLNAIENHTLSGVRYLNVKELGSPARIGRDANDRVLIVQNFEVDKEPS